MCPAATAVWRAPAASEPGDLGVHDTISTGSVLLRSLMCSLLSAARREATGDGSSRRLDSFQLTMLMVWSTAAALCHEYSHEGSAGEVFGLKLGSR